MVRVKRWSIYSGRRSHKAPDWSTKCTLGSGEWEGLTTPKCVEDPLSTAMAIGDSAVGEQMPVGL